jgi:hypothetical protein
MATLTNEADLTLERPDPLGVLETTAPVVAAARSVRIATAPPAWDTHYQWADGAGRTANAVLLLDALNFCFWPDPGEPRWQIEYRGEWVGGYWALAAALKRALEEGGCPLWDADFLQDIGEEDADSLFHPEGRSTGRIPLFRARLANMREVGRVLCERYDGWFGAAIEATGHSAPALARRLAEEFPSFDDVAEYDGREVRLLKRAQICASDLYGAFGGRHWGALRDLDALTAFADYKVPQLLRAEGVLVYTPALAARIAAREPLPAGGPEEVEIRAATVWGVELLRRALAGRGVALRAFELDWALWSLAQGRVDMAPYHRTRTAFY